MLGATVYDTWSKRYAQVVAGAQADGLITISFGVPDCVTVAVKRTDLVFL